ncbi:MAG: efflux RND transporter periplasmic adaptor subunit [Bacteroidota bacterium]
MKRYTLLAGLLTGMLFLAACGGQEPDTLEGKRTKLADLQAQYAELGEQIAALEAEIGDSSSTTASVVRTPVSVVTLTPSTFQHFVKVQGAIESDNNIIVSPEAAGMYTRVLAKEGQFVKRGQLMAQLDDDVYTKSLDELTTQLELATTLYEKQQRLWDQKIGSEVQLLQAKTQKESLEKRIATTEEQKSMTRIYAPISGVVEQVFAKRGESTGPGLPSFYVVNLSELSFNADVSEAYIPYIKRGDKVKLDFPAVDYQLESKVSSVSQTVNLLNRTVTVKVNLPGKHELLKANMTGEISINDATNENVITISREFIQQGGEGSYVVIAERNESGDYVARKQPVGTGMSYNGQVEILEGLKNGQLMVTEGYLSLSSGQPITFASETASK